jgi:hypothetical protein
MQPKRFAHPTVSGELLLVLTYRGHMQPCTSPNAVAGLHAYSHRIIYPTLLHLGAQPQTSMQLVRSCPEAVAHTTLNVA